MQHLPVVAPIRSNNEAVKKCSHNFNAALAARDNLFLSNATRAIQPVNTAFPKRIPSE